LKHMEKRDIAQQRLYNQHLSSADLKKPADVVQWLGAVQAQDYNAAKWALGLRMQDATDESIENAFASGQILRTHVMRPTWHFVNPNDIRWLLQLTGPRVNAALAYNNRRLELDAAVFKRSNRALANALRGGRQLTREVLRTVVQKAAIAVADPLRFIHILARAEIDGIICSGARQCKQFTYALLDERVPHGKTLAHDEALAELTRRYFTSHGPATLQDFVWWSGLTSSDARCGLDLVQHHLVKEVIDGKPYWFSSAMPRVKQVSRVGKMGHAGPAGHLLPAYDEYLVSYKDRSAALTVSGSHKTGRDSVVFGFVIVIGGIVMGNWKRTLTKNAVVITPDPFARLSRLERQIVVEAADRYGVFLGMPVVLE
jgi:hypothetical protein